MNQEEYDETFEVKNSESKKLRNAYNQVCDIRKFEIDLYWKRATYFWALIAVAFAGYFAVLSSDIDEKLFLSFVVGCVGFVFTFAWFVANRGSKYWQENWENHLDLLEDQISGPLYKTILERPGLEGIFEKLITGPLSLSVSKINQWIGVFVIFIWACLICYSGCKSLKSLELLMSEWLIILGHISIVTIALIVCIMMVCQAKTHKQEHTPKTITRETWISDK